MRVSIIYLCPDQWYHVYACLIIQDIERYHTCVSVPQNEMD